MNSPIHIFRIKNINPSDHTPLPLKLEGIMHSFACRTLIQDGQNLCQYICHCTCHTIYMTSQFQTTILLLKLNLYEVQDDKENNSRDLELHLVACRCPIGKVHSF